MIFFSDVHLRDGDSPKTKRVLRFLDKTASQHEKIFILGDLFDVWPGTDSHLLATFKPVTDALRKLTKAGHEVHYVEGNHDFRLGKFFSDELNISVHPESHTEIIGGRRVYMCHGDLGNPKELGYRALRYLLRQDLLHLIKGAFPPRWTFELALKSSKASRGYQVRFPTAERSVKEIYRKTAKALFRDFDVVLMGHTHYPDDYSEKTHRYINIGDWLHHFTYLEFDGSDFYTKCLTE